MTFFISFVVSNTTETPNCFMKWEKRLGLPVAVVHHRLSGCEQSFLALLCFGPLWIQQTVDSFGGWWAENKHLVQWQQRENIGNSTNKRLKPWYKPYAEETEERRAGMSALTDKVIHSMPHHVGGFGGAVKAQVLGHRLLLLGRFTDLLKKRDQRSWRHDKTCLLIIYHKCVYM